MSCVVVIASITVLLVNVLTIEAKHRSKRVVGGEAIPISKVPWVAMIESKYGQYCAGTIISKTAVLTSADCMSQFRIEHVSVVIGVEKKDHVKEENRFTVKSVIQHPKYKGGIYLNDIAIVILEKSVDITKYPPIQLPPPEKQTYSNACVAGWGSTDPKLPHSSQSNDLREVCFTSDDFKDCSKHFLGMANSTIQICVGTKDKNSCNGDTGGPLYIEFGGQATQIGIVSYGTSCGKYDSVYTRVSVYVQWILDAINAP